jgi:hypothetical protein
MIVGVRDTEPLLSNKCPFLYRPLPGELARLAGRSGVFSNSCAIPVT